MDAKLAGNAFILPPRILKVWLPPDYYTNTDNRPVIYCHDGQNAIQDSESWTGHSWRLAGALTRLHEHNCINTLPIVVLLPSASDDLLPGILIRRRHLEYGDVNLPFAQAHADFVALTVKPLVDITFRTLPQETYAIGSSLGGQASLHLVLRHPRLFQGAACLSPFFGPATQQLVSNEDSLIMLQRKKLYFDMGGDYDNKRVPVLDPLDHLTSKHWWNPGYFWLDTQLQAPLEKMLSILNDGNVSFHYQQIAGGRHNERAWSMRIDQPLLCMLGDNK